MPNLDGTGPQGQAVGQGRRGRCGHNSSTVLPTGKGGGRRPCGGGNAFGRVAGQRQGTGTGKGLGRGFGRGRNVPMNAKDEQENEQ